ncbi:hypothetical protein LXL04_029856 [Taraxacum kok-saghyz]
MKEPPSNNQLGFLNPSSRTRLGEEEEKEEGTNKKVSSPVGIVTRNFRVLDRSNGNFNDFIYKCTNSFKLFSICNLKDALGDKLGYNDTNLAKSSPFSFAINTPTSFLPTLLPLQVFSHFHQFTLSSSLHSYLLHTSSSSLREKIFPNPEIRLPSLVVHKFLQKDDYAPPSLAISLKCCEERDFKRCSTTSTVLPLLYFIFPRDYAPAPPPLVVICSSFHALLPKGEQFTLRLSNKEFELPVEPYSLNPLMTFRCFYLKPKVKIFDLEMQVIIIDGRVPDL